MYGSGCRARPSLSSPAASRVDGDRLVFNYGQSYLARREAIADLRARAAAAARRDPARAGLAMPSCLRDGAPDAWGRRVIINRMLGLRGREADVDVLDELTYLLESGSDRIGALDFQASPTTTCRARARAASLEELLHAAEKVERRQATRSRTRPGAVPWQLASAAPARKRMIDDGES